jgi:hypothetical protein
MVTIELVNGQTMMVDAEDAEALARDLSATEGGYISVTDNVGQVSYLNRAHVVRVSGGTPAVETGADFGGQAVSG